MPRKPPGLFITGTDTDVGKTYVGGLIARALCRRGVRVGVYKPVASGCRDEQGVLVSEDGLALWEAAGRPGEFERVCPQRFRAPLAPPRAARAEGKTVDPWTLRQGVEFWQEISECVLVEGAGGLLSPVTDAETIADLARDLGYPLIVVGLNQIGAINQVWQTLVAAAQFCPDLPVAGIILNHSGGSQDPSRASNREELARRVQPPVLAVVAPDDRDFAEEIDWLRLAQLQKN
jgi:dethiobiotin synthetase